MKMVDPSFLSCLFPLVKFPDSEYFNDNFNLGARYRLSFNIHDAARQGSVICHQLKGGFGIENSLPDLISLFRGVPKFSIFFNSDLRISPDKSNCMTLPTAGP